MRRSAWLSVFVACLLFTVSHAQDDDDVLDAPDAIDNDEYEVEAEESERAFLVIRKYIGEEYVIQVRTFVSNVASRRCSCCMRNGVGLCKVARSGCDSPLSLLLCPQGRNVTVFLDVFNTGVRYVPAFSHFKPLTSNIPHIHLSILAGECQTECLLC